MAKAARRVLLLIGTLRPGGTERQVCYLASGLARAGHEVAIALINGRPAVAYELDERVAVMALGHGGVGGALRAWLALRRTAPQWDIVVSFLDAANALSGASPRPREYLAWSVRSNGVPAKLSSRAVFAAARLLSSRCALCIANSGAVERFYRASGFRPARFAQLPNAIDLDRFRPDPRQGAAERASLGIPAGALLVISVARLHPDKRHDLMLKAFARLREQRTDAHLLCVGEGLQGSEELTAQTQALGLAGCVHLLPPRRDVTSLLNASDVALNLSNREGFPNSLMEAMACAVPCVASRVGGSSELLVQGGLLSTPGDAESAAEALLRYAQDAALRQAHGAAGRALVEERHSLASVAERFEQLLMPPGA